MIVETASASDATIVTLRTRPRVSARRCDDQRLSAELWVSPDVATDEAGPGTAGSATEPATASATGTAAPTEAPVAGGRAAPDSTEDPVVSVGSAIPSGCPLAGQRAVDVRRH